MNPPPLHAFIEQVLATAQAGLTYSRDPFDIQRFEALRAACVALLAEPNGLDPAALAGWIRLDAGYPTPKLDVRAMMRDEHDRLLLVREKSDGLWTLPGGWCDIGDSPADAVVREVREETGLVCEAVQLLALFDKLKHPHPPQLPHAHKAFFHCRIIAGALQEETDETSAAGWFAIDALPPLSRHRVVAEQLARLHAHLLAGRPETLFD
ncbi:NUDIX hydrolase [Aeromonas simiae]|uniref:NUDIX hydrolase n=1 Tax=Aeromonas simiae TaxID=218936 RepID=A0A5J6WZE6_9GAMM|nr:NUDIX hydrolase [Aeromonas simiae]QFI55651.1 NUDIX hydrolase [Aeromonas simiae]